MWLLATKLHGPVSSGMSHFRLFSSAQKQIVTSLSKMTSTSLDSHPAGLQGASRSQYPSCLPTSALDFFYSSCFPTILQHGGVHATANGLPLKGLEVFDQSCVQRCLRHHDSRPNTASLPTTALDLFHFSAMRRLLHNSGKCLMPEAALDLFAGSVVQKAMAADLGTSFQFTSLKVSTQQTSYISAFVFICLPQRHAAYCLTLCLLFSDSLVLSRSTG